MSHLVRLALASAWNRRGTLALTALAIALSVAMLLGVERLRVAARAGFQQAVSGTDLIVGARTSPVQLLLFAVFRLGEPTTPMRWASVEKLAANPRVAWTVPITLGDSFEGFAVVGTMPAYFEHFRYGDREPLRLAQGRAFAGTVDGLFEAVLGAEVARTLGLAPGARIALRHGLADVGGPAHDDKPFAVVGVLAPTGTPVDRSVHVSLAAIEALHLDWAGGAPMPGMRIAPEFVRKFDLKPKAVTAVLVGLQQRAAAFRVQREVQADPDEALVAVLPGVALDQLWQVVGVAERTLLAVSAMIVAIGLAGLVAVVLASLNERRRELAILRSVGAGPRHVAALLLAESLAVTLAGAVAGGVMLALAAWVGADAAQSRLGVALSPWITTAAEWRLLGWIGLAALAAGAIPAWRASRLALADGLSPRL